MSLKFWILNERHEPVCLGGPEKALEWAAWYNEPANIRVAESYVGAGKDWWVSTIFLGTDQSFGMIDPPVLFETKVFWLGEASLDTVHWDGYQERYSAWFRAEAAHRRITRELRAAVDASETAEAAAEAFYIKVRRRRA